MSVPGNIESALEAYRRTIAPPVIDGERYLKRRQASYDGGNAMFACWKPGYLLLTPTRLLFYQGESQLFEVALASVQSVEVLTRRWLTRKSCEQLVVTYQTRRGPRSVCLRTEDLKEWRECIQKNLPSQAQGVPPTPQAPPRWPTRSSSCESDNEGILPAAAHRSDMGHAPPMGGRDEAESTPKSFPLATPWAAYEAWRGRFGFPPFWERRKPPQTSDQESEIL